MTQTPPSSPDVQAPDLHALAAEVCAAWQAHLTAMGANPAAKADMAQMTEPTRRLFTDWAAMMQNGGYGKNVPPAPFGFPAFGPAPFGAAPDAGAERVAELTRCVAELEERLAILENAGRSAKP